MIIVVEGPSAAGKTTWCQRHAPRFLHEPGRWPIDEVRRYQLERWQNAVRGDGAGELIVLDGDPFKLYYAWAQYKLGQVTEAEWEVEVARSRQLFVRGDHGLADLVLYAEPSLDELVRRKQTDSSRTRRNFDLHTAMRPHFRHWYEVVARIDPARVIWEHPAIGLTDELLRIGPRDNRSSPELFNQLMAGLQLLTRARLR